MLDIDTAIKHCLEVAEQNEAKAQKIGVQFLGTTKDREATDCRECATDYRQLAEWLTELKQWRRVYGVCPSYEMCIPECKEGYNAQITEYKRLLKAAVEDFNILGIELDSNCEFCGFRLGCEECPLYRAGINCRCWKHQDEALALIGEDTNVPASADDINVGHKSGGWISVKDRLPDDCVEVLVYDTDCGVVIGWYDEDINDFAADFISSLDAVTHWQPLPEPPKDGEQNGKK